MDESLKKRGAVSSLRLGMNPQAVWLPRVNPAFKKRGVIVIKRMNLILRSALKAPFMGRSFGDGNVPFLR